MWVAMLTVPCFYRNLCLDLPDSWSLPTIEDGMCKDHSIHVHSISTKLWLFFFVSNWSMILLLDAVYRRVVQGRTNFERVPTGLSLKRSMSFLVFPLSDVFLFVLPTLHAHARMLLSTKF